MEKEYLIILKHSSGDIRVGLGTMPDETFAKLKAKHNQQISVKDEVWDILFPHGYWFDQGYRISNHCVEVPDLVVMSTDEPPENWEIRELIPKAHLEMYDDLDDLDEEYIL